MGIYDNCKIYGPYQSKQDNRLRIIIEFPNGNKQSKSYPKYLMEVQENRFLEENETVDHIDGNPLNNDLSNLQILDRKVHCSVDVLRNKDIIVKCTYCQKEFTIPGSEINNRNRQDRHSSGYFCSRSCSGKYGQEIQSGKRKPEEPHEKIIPKKYKAKSALGEIPDVEVG